MPNQNIIALRNFSILAKTSPAVATPICVGLAYPWIQAEQNASILNMRVELGHSDLSCLHLFMRG